MKKILLLVSLAFVSLLVCANPEDDRGVPMRAQGACPPVHVDFHKNKGKTANYLDRNGNVKIIS